MFAMIGDVDQATIVETISLMSQIRQHRSPSMVVGFRSSDVNFGAQIYIGTHCHHTSNGVLRNRVTVCEINESFPSLCMLESTTRVHGAGFKADVRGCFYHLQTARTAKLLEDIPSSCPVQVTKTTYDYLSHVF